MKARNAFHWRHSKLLDLNLFTLIPKQGPPGNVTIFKGSNQVAVTRSFIVYFLRSRESLELVEWFADTLAPDEYIWPTLNHNPHLRAPGGYKGILFITVSRPCRLTRGRVDGRKSHKTGF